MSDGQKQLSEIWSIFRRAGVADDLVIIDHIARLILESDDQTLSRSARRSRLSTEAEAEVRQILDRAITTATDGSKDLFDPHVLFRLTKMLPGGRYPTPRHIVRTMLNMAEVTSDQSLVDLACGSGGFLAYRAQGNGSTGRTIGIEISPEWARLAQANTRLHGLVNARVIEGNALQVCGPEGGLASETFDRILMNPPFGERVDPMLVRNAVGRGVGGRSETAFLALALRKLGENGRAAVLVPDGILSSEGISERGLRRLLLNVYEVEAVLSFPEGVFQPFNTTRANLVLVRRGEVNRGGWIWFFNTEHDGYPSGRGRDLTTPPEAGDLPFIEGVVTTRGDDFDALFPSKEHPLIGMRTVKSEHGDLLGVVVQAVGQTTLSSVERFPAIEHTASFVIIEANNSAGSHVYLRVSSNAAEVQQVSNPQQLIRDLYKPSGNEPDPGVRTIAESVDAARSVALIADGRTLGVEVSIGSIEGPIFDLRPGQFLAGEEEAAHSQSPSTLLDSVYRNQKLLARHLDNLSRRMGLEPIARQELPSRLADELSPLGRLSEDQQSVWRRVTEQIDMTEDGSHATASYFTLNELVGDAPTEVREKTRSTLDLLERMGLIVTITISDPNLKNPAPFYRLVTRRDLWKRPQAANSNGEQA